MINKAIQIAMEAHKNQTDKAGQPYIFHLLRVSEKGQTEIEKICGLLHDLIEDTCWTFEDLKKEGFSDEIIEILNYLTKKNNQSYEDYIVKIAYNTIATKIKLRDLKDNMDITRLSKITEKDIKRLNKYLTSYNYLKEQLNYK